MPPKVATKAHPSMLPPVATQSPITISPVVSFQTDANQEAVEMPPRALTQLGESFARPVAEEAAPAKPYVSARPPALPTSISHPPPRPASALTSPVDAVARPSATQTAAASTADEPWMSEPIGGQADRSRRRRRKSNPVREFLKIVIGGIIGLALGNAVLFWGLKIDLFNMAKHLPAFMVPEKLTPKGEPTTGIISSADSRIIVEARPIAGAGPRFSG
jgi:hypothetical protein